MKICSFIVFVHIHKALGLLDSCTHGGKEYKDGDYFRPNGAVMKTESPQHCVQCRCHKGLVICEIEKCVSPNCETPVHEPEYCCQRCPELMKISNGSSNFLLQKWDSRKKKKTGCTANGKYYVDGSIWQPVVGPLGVMSCVQCRCETGIITCNRYQCKELPCSHPQNEFGNCCRVCPNPDYSSKESPEECLPKSSELFVWKTSNSSETFTEIEYAFLEEKTKNDIVHLHSWNTSHKGIDVFAMRTISHKELLGRNMRLLGAVSYRRFRRYLKREEKLRTTCFIHCAKKIFRMEKALKVYPVKLRKNCNEDELNIAKIW